jgi:Cu/Ag efflux protein CusF
MHYEKMIKVVAAFWMSLTFAAMTFAETATLAAPAAPSMEMKAETEQATVLTGEVKSVDAKAGKLTIQTSEREIKLTTDSKTTKAALERLKIGDTARVFEKGGKVIAASPVKTDSKTKAAND